MKYYSTNGKADRATLHEAVVKGLASDKGLFMPEVIRHLPESFFDEIQDLSFQEVAYRVADAFFGEDVEHTALENIVCVETNRVRHVEFRLSGGESDGEHLFLGTFPRSHVGL